MKILIISDSHGNKKGIENLISSQCFDEIIFLGDGLKDLDPIEKTEINLKKVAGNCDFFSDEAQTQIFNLKDKRFLICHGHTFKAKLTKMFMLEYAKQNMCDIVLYGHTHQQKIENIDGIIFANPGCFGKNQYAIIEIDKDKLEIKTFNQAYIK